MGTGYIQTKMGERIRSALITGGSSGVGKALLDMLLDAGVEVWATSREPEKQINRKNLHWLYFNGEDRANIFDFCQANQSVLEQVDLLILNAGSGVFGSWDRVETHHIDQQLDLLATSVFLLSKAHVSASAGRPIVQVWVSSLASLFPLPFMPLYSAAKAAISAATESLILSKDPGNLTLIDFRLGDYRTAFNQNVKRLLVREGSSEADVWRQLEINLQAGPLPERAAVDLRKAIQQGRPATIYSGGFFQRVVAPLANRLVSRRLFRKMLRVYFKL